MKAKHYAIVLLLILVSTAAGADDCIWWEAESPTKTNFPERSAFEPSKLRKPEMLSAGGWLSASGNRQGDELFARYSISIPADGEYQLWARKFWRHGAFRWRIDEKPWQVFPRDAGLADEAWLGPNVSANWVAAGGVTLSAGAHTVELRLLAGPGQDITAAFDCFALTRDTFVPRGKLKPGETSGAADDGFFPFEPDVDRFADSPIDLRHLNEPVAGQSGFLQRSGSEIALGDGTPARFWAVNIGSNNISLDHRSIDYMARKLAKLGVNMVRFHSPLFHNKGDVSQLDAAQLDDLFYTIAAMKHQGIYTTLSFYFPVWAKITPDYHIDGYEDLSDPQPFALLFFNPRMQELYRSWARQLLASENPYTHLPLARDPAVGIVEIINEDSLFFWTFTKQKIPPIQWRRLEQMFSDWTIAKYGSVPKALDAWNDEALDGDDASKSHVALYEAAHMTSKVIDHASAGKRARVGDQVQFLAELQRNFYVETRRFLKDDLGYGGLVSASNWTVSDSRLLSAIERWTYTAGDVIDRHGYFEPKHEGDGAAWSVRVGHTFTSRAGVQNPQRVPLQFAQVQGFPQIISELGWPNPNRFRADATLLCSAYGSLQGVDAMYLFALDSDFLLDTQMQKFSISSPAVAGTFPACALQYRRRDVAEAEPLIVQSLNLRDLFAMKGTPAAAAAQDALDQFRARDLPPGAELQGAQTTFDPLSFYAGPFVQNYDARPEQSRQKDLRPLIDRDKQKIRSSSGEIVWNYGTGVVTANTPRSQGAAGFLAAAGEIDLGDVRIRCGNEFASIVVISLDDLPLRQSRQILVQGMTEERPLGFKTAGDKIADLGSYPFGIRRIDATIAIKSAGAETVTLHALDENGYIRSTAAASAAELTLAPDAVYSLITRSSR